MKTICSLRHISYKREQVSILEDINLFLKEGTMSALVGGNGSGKTSLADIIAGKKIPADGSLQFLEDEGKVSIGYLSFEEQEELLAQEREKDETWLLDGRTDYGSSGAEIIGRGTEFSADSPDFKRYLELLRIGHLLNSGCRQYSTGEFRKVLLCRELMRHPDLLILDEPYDGLDAESRLHIRETLPHLCRRGGAVLLLLHRVSEVPEYADTVVYLYEGRLHESPPPARARHDLREAMVSREGDDLEHGEVISCSDVAVAYNGKQVLNGINWSARGNETWMITGPNGSGKSTLLSLISGDNPKAYGQEIYLFGRKRGSGESIWDIKERIGFVSGDLQFSYHVRASVREVVISGLYDSIGLYRRPNDHQQHEAAKWLKSIGLEKKGEESFHKLSFGEQRMVLLARAMIKGPEILIADEPCQGLDEANRKAVLLSLEYAAQIPGVLLLYVTHEPEEYLRVSFRHLELVPHPAGGFTGKITEMSFPA